MPSCSFCIGVDKSGEGTRDLRSKEKETAAPLRFFRCEFNHQLNHAGRTPFLLNLAHGRS